MVPDTQPNEADCGGADRVHRTLKLSLMHLSTLSSVSQSVSRLENVECEKSDFNISFETLVLESGEEHGGGGRRKKIISAATDSSPKYTKTQTQFEKRKTKNHVEH